MRHGPVYLEFVSRLPVEFLDELQTGKSLIIKSKVSFKNQVETI